MGNLVAIVGRPNVGKSTLFNRLTGMRQAIVDSVSGVTRDRHYGKSDWNGKEFSIIDTGGYVEGSDDIFEEEIRKQAELAVDEADAILFMVDVEQGLSPLDEDVANFLRKSRKAVFVVANKVDNQKRRDEIYEFMSLGLGEVYGISAINGSGTGELLDAMVADFTDDKEEDSDLPRFAVVGRPNVGKSSFINALLGNERNIVTNIAGTTRDTIFTEYKSFGFHFNLVDTAGIRKKKKVSEDIEFYSVMRSIRAIEYSDVCILIIDATQGFEAQDLNIFQLAQRNKKGIVILVNKWDLVEKDTNAHLRYSEKIKKQLEPFSDVPVIFTSVVNKQRIHKALETAQEVYENRSRRVSTSELNEKMLEIIQATPPPAVKGKYIKIKYVTQLKTASPCFAFFANLPQYIRDPYKRFLENRLRSMYNFTGVPIQIFIRKK